NSASGRSNPSRRRYVRIRKGGRELFLYEDLPPLTQRTLRRPMDTKVNQNRQLIRVARFPGLRVLAWSGDQLYASRGYQLLRSTIQNPTDNLSWHPVAAFHAPWRRQLSVSNSLSARLFRDGFHALAILPSGALVA